MCEDSRLPAWSTRLTRVGARLATLPATILMTAAMVSGVSVRPVLVATTTEADDLSPSLEMKEVDLAIDRWTGVVDGVQRHDRLRQLALQAAAEAHVLDELRHAQRVVLVHQLQAGRQLRGHALGSQ